jgi:L-2-hydroxycarboxylate dehydrogenase (NAD+)
MLERFKVSEDDEVRVSYENLRATVAAIFEKVGVPAEDATIGAEVLAYTDLRGIETHGVSNMLRIYVGWYRDGTLNPTPSARVLRETPAAATIESDGGLGLIDGVRAMRRAIDKAREVGVGIVTVRNSGHLGAAGHHALLAAEQGMVGVAMTAAPPQVLPTFGAEPRLGTNPIAFAAPAHSEPVVCFDVATSTIAGNKMRLAQRVGSKIEPGWIARPDGSPIVEPVDAPAPGEYFLLPLGGTRDQGSHKGYGFALMVEVLSTLLAGAIPSMVDPGPFRRFNHFLAAYDIAAFTDVEQFKDTMDAMLRTLKETPPAPGEERVIYPGMLEYEEEQARRAHGIPLHREVIEWFDGITTELSLPRLARSMPGVAGEDVA